MLSFLPQSTPLPRRSPRQHFTNESLQYFLNAADPCGEKRDETVHRFLTKTKLCTKSVYTLNRIHASFKNLTEPDDVLNLVYIKLKLLSLNSINKNKVLVQVDWEYHIASWNPGECDYVDVELLIDVSLSTCNNNKRVTSIPHYATATYSYHLSELMQF